MSRAIATALVVSVTLITGCATEGNLRKALDDTIGWTENQLVARLGPPDNVYRSDAANEASAKFITYRRGNSGVVPGYVNCIGYYCYTMPPQQYVNACAVTFSLLDGKVTHYRYEGNACRL
jgi:hypothetical protein